MTPTRRAAVVLMGALAVILASLPSAFAGTNAPAASPSQSTSTGGYWMMEANGNVYGFGDARPLTPLVQDSIVAAAGLPNGGYLLLSGDGIVIARGTPYLGSANLGNDVATSISALSDGSGYWVFTQRGAVYPFGNAQGFGDMTGTRLNGGIVASAATPSGQGYWMVGADGGIFSFGDAQFYGSTGNIRLNKPVVGIAPDPDGVGYWLVAADGGIFAFSAGFRGSVPGALGPNGHLNRPVIGALAYGNGYLMVASDGGIFAFSNLPFLGSLGASPPLTPIVAVAVRAPGSGGVITTTTTDQPTTTTEQPATTTTTQPTTTTTQQPGPTASLTGSQVGPGTVQVRWPDGITPTKLARNGADGGWDTDRDGFGGVPASSLGTHTFQFTALAPGLYNFTMTYGGGQTVSTDAVQVLASTTDPATPGVPSAVSRVQSARLLYSKVDGDVARYEWNATVTACCFSPWPSTGWHTIPADAVVDLHGWGSGGAGYFRFQVRACNTAGVCGVPSALSDAIQIYHQVDIPKGNPPTVIGGTATWSWFSQVGSGIAKPETYTPTISFFTATLWNPLDFSQNVGSALNPKQIRVSAQPGAQPGAMSGTYTQTFPRDGKSYTFEVFAHSIVDGVEFTSTQAFFNSPPIN